MISAKAAAVAVLMLASATDAYAQNSNEIDGNELLMLCEQTQIGPLSYCHGYVIGIAQMFSETGMYGVKTCPTTTIPEKQIVDIVVKNLKANPEDRHIGARYLIVGAIAQTFPCRTGSGKK